MARIVLILKEVVAEKNDFRVQNSWFLSLNGSIYGIMKSTSNARQFCVFMHKPERIADLTK